MKTIYKYPLQTVDEPQLNMPRGARVLSFHSQNDQPCIWALVDPDEPVQLRRFYLAGTGQPFKYNPASLRFIGTALFMGDTLVFHLFEID